MMLPNGDVNIDVDGCDGCTSFGSVEALEGGRLKMEPAKPVVVGLLNGDEPLTELKGLLLLGALKEKPVDGAAKVKAGGAPNENGTSAVFCVIDGCAGAGNAGAGALD